MSADEIRRLVRIYNAKEKNLKDQLDKFKGAEMLPNLENISIARKDAIMTIKALLAYAAMVERCEEIKSKYCLARNRIDKVTSLHPDATYEMILSKIKEFDYILKGATNERK